MGFLRVSCDETALAGTGFVESPQEGRIGTAQFGRGWLPKMTITVYFSCPQCRLLYEVEQIFLPEKKTGGNFACVRCHAPIHSWRGLYDYPRWTPLTGHS